MNRIKNKKRDLDFNPLNSFKNQNKTSYEERKFIETRQNVIKHSKKCVKDYFNKIFNHLKGLRMREFKKFVSGTVLLTLFTTSPILKEIQPVYAAEIKNSSTLNTSINDTGFIQEYEINLEEATFSNSSSVNRLPNAAIKPTVLSKDDEQLILAIIDTGINPDLNVFKGHLIKTEGYETGKLGDSHGNKMASVALDVKHNIKIMPFNYESNKYVGHAAAIRQAVDNGADAISMSFSIGFNRIMPDYLVRDVQEAIDYAYQHNVPVFVAAGNEGKDYPESTLASLNHVFAVAAVDKNGRHAVFSSVGQNVFCAELGVDIPAINLEGEKVYINGTSPATPRAAAKALMVKEIFPQITVDQLMVVISQNCTDLSKPGRDDETGYGIFNPENFKGPLPQGKDINAPNVIYFNDSNASFSLIDVSKIDSSNLQTSVSGTLLNGSTYKETKINVTEREGKYLPNISKLNDGKYQLNIFGAKDENGNIVNTKKYFMRDATPPKIAVSYEYSHDNTSEIIMDIKSSDSFGIKSYTAHLDYKIIDKVDFLEASENKNCKFNLKIDTQKLTSGKHTLFISCNDGSHMTAVKYDLEIFDGKVISFKEGIINEK